MAGEVFIFGAGGSGGSSGGSELTVVGGTTRPSKASHNTIWVNTDVEITSYILSATEPESPVSGMVWITIKDSGAVKIASPVGGDWITVYPISAMQYNGGAWVKKEAKSYQNGAWSGWATYLYNKGNLCEDITGGWKNINGFEYHGYHTTGAYYDNGNSFTLRVTSGASHIARITNNKIDFTNVNNISVVALECNGGVLTLSTANTALSSNVASFPAECRIDNKGTTSLDVSAVTGEYYVAIRTSNGAGDNTNRAITVSQIYLE